MNILTTNISICHQNKRPVIYIYRSSDPSIYRSPMRQIVNKKEKKSNSSLRAAVPICLPNMAAYKTAKTHHKSRKITIYYNKLIIINIYYNYVWNAITYFDPVTKYTHPRNSEQTLTKMHQFGGTFTRYPDVWQPLIRKAPDWPRGCNTWSGKVRLGTLNPNWSQEIKREKKIQIQRFAFQFLNAEAIMQ